MKQFAIVTEQYAPAGGGAERNVVEVARRLAASGHGVTILAGEIAGGDSIDRVIIEPCPTGPPSRAKALRRFNQWVRQRLAGGGFDASLSVTSLAPAMVVQPLGGTVRATLDRNVAMRETPIARFGKRVTIALNSKYRAALRIERAVMHDPGVKRFAALSRFVADQLTGLYSVDPSRVVVIRNAVDLPPTDATVRGQLRTKWREQLQIGDKDVAFLFAAFNPRLKGLRTVLRALSWLRGEPVVVLVAGPVRRAERRLAAALAVGGQVRGQVRWLGPTGEMEGLRAAADAVVAPTHYDPSSRVVMEAVRCGLPVIGSAFDGSMELLTDAAVVLADPADDAALAAAMRGLADPAERQRLAQAASMATAGGMFTMDRHVAELEALLLEVASEA